MLAPGENDVINPSSLAIDSDDLACNRTRPGAGLHDELQVERVSYCEVGTCAYPVYADNALEPQECAIIPVR